MYVVIVLVVSIINNYYNNLPVNRNGRDGEGGDEDEDPLENNDVGRADSEGGRRIMALALWW